MPNRLDIKNHPTIMSAIMGSMPGIGESHDGGQEWLKYLCESSRPLQGLTATAKPLADPLSFFF